MTRSNSRRAITALLAVALAMTGCNRKTVFSHYEHTALSGWSRTDTLVFNLPPATATGHYALQLGLRASSEYPFTTLSLIVSRQKKPSEPAICDTLVCQITDTEGNILGRGMHLYQYTLPVCSLHLAEGDSLRVTVRHDMKRERLQGIADVGITLRLQD